CRPAQGLEPAGDSTRTQHLPGRHRRGDALDLEVGADPDRACETRRRGARWRLRAGLFASPVSTFAPLFVCLRGCLLAIVLVLWIRIAHRDACTTTSPALGARRGGGPKRGPSTWTAMLAVPGKSSGMCGGTTFFLQR